MNGLELEKGELFVTRQKDFIASVIIHEDDTFGLHIKIETCTGCIYNIEFPLERLRRFKGII